MVQKHSSKKRLKKKEKNLIQERLIVFNSVGKDLGLLDKNLDRGLPEAISMLNEAVEVGEKVFPGSLLLADAYHNLACSHAFRGSDLDQALEYYDQALKIKMACLGEEHFSTARTYYGIGTAYLFFQEYNSAISYVKKSLSIMLNCPIEEAYPLIIKAYEVIGRAYENQDDYSSALKYYKKGLSFASNLPEAYKEVRASSYIIQLHRIIGQAYENQNDYSSALKYYEEALSFASKLPDSDKEFTSTYIAWIEVDIKHVQEKLAKQDQVKVNQ